MVGGTLRAAARGLPRPAAATRWENKLTPCKVARTVEVKPHAAHRTAPPLTRITCPVRYAAAGETNQRAAAATSSGVPQRPSGVSRSTRSCHPPDAPAPHAVLIHPGARQLTRTSGASVRARLLVKAITAALVAPNSWPLSPSMPVSA